MNNNIDTLIHKYNMQIEQSKRIHSPNPFLNNIMLKVAEFQNAAFTEFIKDLTNLKALNPSKEVKNENKNDTSTG